MQSRTMIISLVLLALLVTFAASAMAGPEKVSPLLRKYTDPQAQGLFDPARYQQVTGVFPAASQQGIRCLVQGDVTRGDLEALGVEVTTQAGNVFTATVPADAINVLSDLPGMIRIQPARYLEPLLDSALSETQIRPQVHGSSVPPYPVDGNVGNGVLIGACDSGFDYTHGDFRDGSNLSRFNSIWDQTVNGTAPAGFGYGTEWTKTSLDNQTSTTTDTDGHGSHVMGIMAGDGSETGNGEPAYQYIGVAPEATMVGVKTLFSDASIIDGVNYIFQQGTALGMDAVANLSLGGQYGPHDGTDPLDTALSALTGSGKILVCSAGNERGEQLHARGTIPVSGSPTTLDFSFQLDSYSKIGGTQNDLVLFDGFYESTDNYTVTVIGPTGQTLGPVSRGVFDVASTSDGAIQIDNGTATNTGGDYEIFIALYDSNPTYSPRAGTWTIRFTRVTSTASNIDLWNYYNSSHMSGRFTTNYTDDVTIGSPGSALQAITVASYVTKSTWQSIDGNTYSYNPTPMLGTLSTFSSRGPLRDGTQKPDIAGPGQGLMSVLSDDVNTTGLQPRIDPDGVHWVLEGTSMSSPMVAGLCALVLARDPGMTPAQMKARLNTYAKVDPYTGAVPNYDWGYGKIRGEAADMTPPTATLLAPNGGQQFIAGASTNITWSGSDNFAVDSVDLYYSTDGGSTYPNLIASGETNDGTYSWTIPSISSTTVRVKVVLFDRIGNSGSDESNSNFEIVIPDVTNPTVTVISPNGGESWTEGSMQTITWSASDTGMNKPEGVNGTAATIAGVDSVSLWYSLNDGGSWTLIASGEDNDGSYSWTLPGTPTDSALVKVQAWDPSLNMGEDTSDAMFTIASATAVGGGAMPVALTLAQSRPNPLSRAASAEIRFGLTREGPVSLRVFDTAGRQVAVLAEGTYPAGFHSVSWDGRLADGSRASSGVYFYRLETREGTQNRKLMIIR